MRDEAGAEGDPSRAVSSPTTAQSHRGSAGKQSHVLLTALLADPGTLRNESIPGIIQGAQGP